MSANEWKLSPIQHQDLIRKRSDLTFATWQEIVRLYGTSSQLLILLHSASPEMFSAKKEGKATEGTFQAKIEQQLESPQQLSPWERILLYLLRIVLYKENQKVIQSEIGTTPNLSHQHHAISRHAKKNTISSWLDTALQKHTYSINPDERFTQATLFRMLCNNKVQLAQN